MSAAVDALPDVTLPQVLAVGAVVWALLQFGGRVWRWAVRAVHFVDRLEAIERQVTNNGGSSMRDAVDRLEAGQKGLEAGQQETNTRVEQVATTQAALAASHENLADEVAQLRHVLVPDTATTDKGATS